MIFYHKYLIFFIYVSYKSPNDLKEVTTIIERLLRRSLTTRIFEIRKEKKVNIDEFILKGLFKIVVNDLNNLSVIVVTSLRSMGPCQLKVSFSTLNALVTQ